MIFALGIIFIILGFILNIFPPKKINSLYGYRTTLSMKNKDTWDEAQKYSAKSFIFLGLLYIILSFILINLLKVTSIPYQIIFLIMGILLMLVFDEMHLKKIFNEDGSRRI